MKKKIGVILVLVALLLMPVSVYAEAEVCPRCNGTGVITETCPQCGGTGIISHELKYAVIDDSVNEYLALGKKADVSVTIRNLDNQTGYFKVTGIATGGGETLTTTVKAFIDPGAVKEVTVTLDIGLGVYEYDYSVEPEIIETTCPKCAGTGEITTTCPECGGTGEVPEEEEPGFEAVFAIVGLLAVAYLVKRRR
jgi:PGF-CTERM protein